MELSAVDEDHHGVTSSGLPCGNKLQQIEAHRDQKYRSPLCIAEADVPDLDHLTYNVLNRASMLVKEHVLHWSQRLGQESAFNSMPHAWTKCCNAPSSH